MIFKSISLTNFRSYSKATFDFDSRTTLIVGPNTSGKTNILEAIYLLATGKPLRAVYDRELIQVGSDFAIVRGELVDSDEEERKEIEVQIIAADTPDNTSHKRFKVNGVGKMLRAFVGQFNTVYFGPENITLILGSPSKRRRYLDSLFSQIDPDYAVASLNYQKALRRRNKVLEAIGERMAARDQLAFWDQAILKEGSYIQKRRTEFFDFAAVALKRLGQRLNGSNGSLSLRYRPSPLSSERLLQYYQKEVSARSTLIGPHREDFSFLWRGYDLARFGSRGEQRSAVLALKLCELEFIENRRETRPLLLLDDVFSELDSAHRQRVLEMLGEYPTILTATDEHIVPDEYRTNFQVIKLTESSIGNP